MILVIVSLGFVINASTSILLVRSVYLILLLCYFDLRSFLLELELDYFRSLKSILYGFSSIRSVLSAS
jgi:hypothetical protein